MDLIKKSSIIITFLLLLYSCKTTNNTVKNKTDNKEKKNKSYANYYKTVSIADSLFYLREYKKSKNILETLFKDLEPINTFRFREYYNYVISKHHIGETIEKKEFLNLIHKYGYTKDQIKKDTILTLYYKKFTDDKKYENLRTQYNASISMELRNQIYKMLEQDQYYRTAYFEEDAFAKGKEVDVENGKKLKELFDKNRYPSQKLIGGLFYDENVVDVETILLHTNDKDRFEYFLPKLKEFIKQGKTNPYIYGMLIDQHHLFNDKEQLYGTYNVDRLDKKKFAFYNKNRKELKIGFPSVEFDVWKDSIFFSKQ